jgi:hypothetical protein
MVQPDDTQKKLSAMATTARAIQAARTSDKMHVEKSAHAK